MRRPAEVELGEGHGVELHEVENGPTPQELQRALAHLAFNQRAALVMRELEGRSYAEIAADLGVSVSAVEALIFRARRALREQLEGQLSCAEAQLAVSRQMDGALPRDAKGPLRAHLRECRECARFARAQRAQRAAFKGLAGVPLPSSLASIFGGGASGSPAVGRRRIGSLRQGRRSGLGRHRGHGRRYRGSANRARAARCPARARRGGRDEAARSHGSAGPHSLRRAPARRPEGFGAFGVGARRTAPRAAPVGRARTGAESRRGRSSKGGGRQARRRTIPGRDTADVSERAAARRAAAARGHPAGSGQPVFPRSPRGGDGSAEGARPAGAPAGRFRSEAASPRSHGGEAGVARLASPAAVEGKVRPSAAGGGPGSSEGQSPSRADGGQGCESAAARSARSGSAPSGSAGGQERESASPRESAARSAPGPAAAGAATGLRSAPRRGSAAGWR